MNDHHHLSNITKLAHQKKLKKKKTTHSWNKKKREKKLKYLGPSNEDLKKTGPKSPLTLSVHLGNPKHHHVKTKRGGGGKEMSRKGQEDEEEGVRVFHTHP
jgi:hypothetical protein